MSARLVGLAVKLAYALALCERLPTVLSQPYVRLRYILGGDRPSQTTHLTRSPTRIHGVGLDRQSAEGGIPRVAPRGLASPLQSLPPILDNVPQTSTSSCSKGSRGLSVQPRVFGIFTETTISPDLSLRQHPSRYSIRAGRNLPDKEFRYLRTVIVTAAVYRGLDSKLRPKANLSS